MSMLQLQETRVAQLLQTIRHQVGNPLQKRIRSVIKAWQKLLEPGSACATVIPLQCSLNNNGSTATKISSSTPNITTSSPSTQSSNGRSKILRNQPTTNHHHHYQEPLPKIPDRKKIFSTTTLPNGCSPKPPPSLNGRVSSVVLDVPKLAKVKSTAELVQEAGGCIDSVTKDRILSNRIAKESDEFPRLVPLAAMRSSRKAKHPPATLPPSTHHQQKSVARNLDRTLPPPPPPPATQPSPQCTPSIPSAKSEMIAKFLENAPTRMESPRETRSIPSDHNHRHHQHHHHKEKRKHGKRRRENKEEGGEDEDTATEPKQPPVTNHMDDWPTLSPLTEEVMREAVETLLRDYHSGRTPSQTELEDVGHVADLLQGTWEEVSASRGDNGRLEPMTALYSVDMGDDQLVHILPWANLGGYKQTFFPPGTTMASDLDRLIDLPEPW
ncbi:unnamed protein product [Taenia asiatica]|uniref:Mediator of RNA polymerase II transcription subunit 26 n=1 Tax=Taenia asiatica TaxID=60517 RepID=A0A0R3WAU4_TAEAS|nr:unnamed protein product [Taenia asiatica]